MDANYACKNVDHDAETWYLLGLKSFFLTNGHAQFPQQLRKTIPSVGWRLASNDIVNIVEYLKALFMNYTMVRYEPA